MIPIVLAAILGLIIYGSIGFLIYRFVKNSKNKRTKKEQINETFNNEIDVNYGANTNISFIKTISITPEFRKRTTIAKNIYYDKLEIYKNRIVGYYEGTEKITWFFKDYKGIDVIDANLNSQFGQIVFLTGNNSNNRVIGIDLFSKQNQMAMNDTNRILICCGMLNYDKTNAFVKVLANDIRKAFTAYANNLENRTINSSADDILKYKELFDSGIITKEEFETKKKKLLNL